MNKKIRQQLTEYFDAPEPVQKQEFLKSVSYRQPGFFDTVLIQIPYIRKWIWVYSSLFFIATIAGCMSFSENIVIVISAMMPFLAMTVVTECGRSEAYGMAELELSTRFPLKYVVLARLGILGFANILLLCALIPLIIRSGEYSFLQTGIYILCPYTTAAFSGLYALRTVRGRGGMIFCFGMSLIISCSVVFGYELFPVLFRAVYIKWWALIFLISGLGSINEGRKMILKTEELKWNL